MDWKEFVPKDDLLIYSKAGYGMRSPLAKRPALLVVDVTYSFVGDKPEPILESIKRFPNSCGEKGWRSISKIKELLEIVRRDAKPGKRVPIFYFASAATTAVDMGTWTAKNKPAGDREFLKLSGPKSIVKEIAPRENDTIITKLKPSAFHGTSLVDALVARGIDTIIVTGCTTSGCVRATVVDAFSYNYNVGVVEECVFDRGELSHKVNLFDMDSKYANVISFDQAKDYFRSRRG
ncbi:MAG TPA: isochorismatase family protein [Nitrososphaerales archaeon]|nr:isochorismatase family protein [Nitrososphaerales archaeon]